MDRNYLVKLVLGVYRVSGLFPDKEPLMVSIREKANEIFADVLLFSAQNPLGLTKGEKKRIGQKILRSIDILEGYFKIAKGQNWVREKNFFVLEQEYDKIRGKVKSIFEQPNQTIPNHLSKEKVSLSLPFTELTERAKKILKFLEEKKRGQIQDFQQILPRLTKRTLRRDAEELLKKKLVERIGQGKYTYYRLKKLSTSSP